MKKLIVVFSILGGLSIAARSQESPTRSRVDLNVHAGTLSGRGSEYIGIDLPEGQSTRVEDQTQTETHLVTLSAVFTKPLSANADIHLGVDYEVRRYNSAGRHTESTDTESGALVNVGLTFYLN